jgi:hypothetical protein
VTLLSICQDAADELQLGNRPITVIGNPATEAQALLRYARRVCRDLASRAPWQSMRIQRQFVALNTPEQPALPDTFQRFIPETMWNLTNGALVVGPVGPVQWQTLIASQEFVISTDGPRFFTRRGNALLMFPTPSGGETVQFEYQSGNFCQSSAGTPQADWLADTDTARISEELITIGIIARYLENTGQPWQSAKADYERRFNTEIRNDMASDGVAGAGDIFGGRRHFSGVPGDRPRYTDTVTWGTWFDTWGGG